MKRRSPGLYVIAAALILAIGVPSAAVGFGEGRDAKLGKRNPSSGSLTRETQIIANNGSYGTRQSNKRNGEGGGAIYGCRSELGKEPCVRANNLKGGRAFEFATRGKEGGSIQVKDTSGPPFTTNATGKVANLDADKVDGKSAEEFAGAGDLGFASVKADGSFVAGRGATASALLRHGPEYAGVLLDGVSAWMARHGFHAVDDLRGMLSVPPGTDEAEYERASYVGALRAANAAAYGPW